ncbi:unnamed protein product [Orchesella dallaii]|uniref:Gustatory receptor n=1 Tax=Orchesella dallaii TaxID=48710 RepID=A0ABP1PP76_9HEXA
MNQKLKSENTPEKPGNRRELTNIICIYFDFAYYVALCPFKLVKNDKNSYFISVWKPQKVICGIFSLLCVLRMITEIRTDTLRQEASTYDLNPVLYFRMILRMFGLVYKFTIMKRFWVDSKEYLDVVNHIHRGNWSPHHNVKILDEVLIKGVLLYGTTICLTDLLCGKYFIIHTKDWTPTWWWRELVSMGRYTFFVGSRPEPNKAPLLSEISAVDVIYAVFTALGLLGRYINGIFSDLCILSYVVTLWIVANTFAKEIKATECNEVVLIEENEAVLRHYSKSTNILEWPEIYNRYKSIRKLAAMINQAFGSLVTAFMAEAIIFYSISLDATLTTNDFFKKANMLHFYCTTFGILFISADICNQMVAIKSWLANDENRKKVPYDEMQIVLYDLLTNEVGIRGSNVFTITYSLVANILSQWFTKIFYGLCAAIALSGLPAGKDFVLSINEWTPTVWYMRLVGLARYTFFIGDRSDLTRGFNTYNLSTTDHVLVVLMGSAMFTRFRFLYDFVFDTLDYLN